MNIKVKGEWVVGKDFHDLIFQLLNRNDGGIMCKFSDNGEELTVTIFENFLTDEDLKKLEESKREES